MIAAWMVYAAALALVLGTAALALERALRLGDRPGRWPWAGALAASTLLPAALALAPAPAPTAEEPVTGVPAELVLPRRAARDAGTLPHRVGLPETLREAGARLEQPLRWLWPASSALLFAWVLASALRLRRKRRRWRAETLDGVPVLISRDTGPAVVGWLPSRVVLPRWTLELDPAPRALLLAHEREHQRARDPWLLLGALAALVAMPWNPALWWQLRRLRLAVEADCDRRVLRRADVGAYGALLLEVGRRGSRLPLAAAAFSEPLSFLERRIRMMTQPQPRAARLRAGALAGGTVLLLVAACEAPRPDPLAPKEAEQEDTFHAARANAERMIVVASMLNTKGLENRGDTVPQAAFNERVQVTVHRFFPDLKSPPTQPLLFVVDSDGRVLRAEATGGDVSASTDKIGLDPDRIASVEVLKGSAVPATPNGVIWVTLKPGATLPPGGLDGARRERERSGTVRIETTVDTVRMEVPDAPPSDTTPETVSNARVQDAIRRFFPDLQGTPPQPIFFVVDSKGQVLRAEAQTGGPIAGAGLADLDSNSIATVQVFKGPAVPAAPKGVIWVTLKPGAKPPVQK